MVSPYKFISWHKEGEPPLWIYKHFRQTFLARLPSDDWFKKRFKPPEFSIMGDGLDNTLYYEIGSNLSHVFFYHTERIIYEAGDTKSEGDRAQDKQNNHTLCSNAA